MRQSTKPHSPSDSRRESKDAIPKFRELRLSAVVAACAWPKRPAEKPRESAGVTPATRFEEG